MILPEFLITSGSLQADRRYEFASGLAEDGDYTAAIDLLQQTLEIANDWPVLPFTLGKYYKFAEQLDNAEIWFKRSMILDPEDRQGAALELERLGIQAIEGNMPPAFVETLFDQYAGHFDEHLVETLDYVVPKMITSAAHGFYPNKTDLRILDLGCGTGLAGERLKPMASHMEGVDLSSGMLEQAQSKGLYDNLVQAELVEYLNASPETSFDLIVTADVLSYFGALEDVFSSVRKSLHEKGYFIFSVQALEQSSSGEDNLDYFLGRARRFSHAQEYLERIIKEAGFSIDLIERAVLRKDEGQNVNGFIIACRVV